MLRERISVLMTLLAVLAGGLVYAAPMANATNTAPTSATYGATAAVDVLRSPGYPACVGSSYSQWSVTSTGNPISQGVYNATGSTVTSRVDLAEVQYHDGTTLQTTAALLKVANIAAGPPATFSLKLYIAPAGTTELLWDTTDLRWETSGSGATESFASTGNAYAVYSGGFLHEGVAGGSGSFGIGTFLMIDDTLPTGTQLIYTPSPGSDNECRTSKTYATAAGMASTSLGGSGSKIAPSTGSSQETPPTLTLTIEPNGGTCSLSEISGVQGTWTEAPNNTACRKTGSQFIGFATSQDGTGTFISPGGPIYFLTSNRIYAIYATPRAPGAPTDVVAVAGRNQVTVSWKAPADPGSSSISNYLAQASPSGRSCVTRLTDADMLTCTIELPATNTKYTFTVQALNSAGWGENSSASAAVSPFDLVLLKAERPRSNFFQRLFGWGSTISMSGRAPGYAPGTSVTPEWKAGNGNWVTERRAGVKVGSNSQISWSKKIKKNLNGDPITVRFVIGAVASDEGTLRIGSTVGLPAAPRNVKVSYGDARTQVNRNVKVSWQAPSNDGGSPITSYQVTLQVRQGSLPVTCKVPANKPLTCTLNTGVLERKKKYTVYVTATSARGQSKPAKAEFRG